MAALRERPLFGYAMGVVTTAAALGLTLLMEAELQRSIFVVFFGAITVTAWVGGLGPALLATLLSVLSADYFMLGARHSLEPQALLASLRW